MIVMIVATGNQNANETPIAIKKRGIKITAKSKLVNLKKIPLLGFLNESPKATILADYFLPSCRDHFAVFHLSRTFRANRSQCSLSSRNKSAGKGTVVILQKDSAQYALNVLSFKGKGSIPLKAWGNPIMNQ